MEDTPQIKVVVNDKTDHFRILLPEINRNHGWGFQLSDMEMWQETFSKVWYHVAIDSATKKPVASVLLALDEASEEEEELYSVGFFYTNPEYRGKGIGTRLFDMMMSITGGKNTFLHGAEKMSPLYAKKYGFDKLLPFVIDYITVKVEDFVASAEPQGFAAKKLDEIPWEDIESYDRTIWPRKRGKFLKRFISPRDDVFTRIVLDSNKKVVGFASLRIQVNGNLRSGPIYADSMEAARCAVSTIFKEDIDFLKYEEAGFLSPAVNTDAKRMYGDLFGGKVSFHRSVQPQFTHQIVDVPFEKVYCVSECSQSLV